MFSVKTCENETVVTCNGFSSYKLIYEGSPVLINGTSDLDRHFHSFGMSICSNEKTSDFFMQTFFLNSLKSNQCLLNDTLHTFENSFFCC